MRSASRFGARARAPVTDRILTRLRLVEMRERLIDQLEHEIDGGGLARLNEVNGAIAAIDAEAVGSRLARVPAGGGDDAGEVASSYSASPLRAVVRDEPGRAAELQIYGADGLVVGLPVSAHRALDLGVELIGAARRRFAD